MIPGSSGRMGEEVVQNCMGFGAIIKHTALAVGQALSELLYPN